MLHTWVEASRNKINLSLSPPSQTLTISAQMMTTIQLTEVFFPLHTFWIIVDQSIGNFIGNSGDPLFLLFGVAAGGVGSED